MFVHPLATLHRPTWCTVPYTSNTKKSYPNSALNFKPCLSGSFFGYGRSHVSETWWVDVILSAKDHAYVSKWVCGSRSRIPRVRGHVKFQVAPIGPKLGEKKPGHGGSMKRILRMRLVKVIEGQTQDKCQLQF